MKKKVMVMKEKLEQAKKLITECKAIATKKAESSEEDSNELMIWLNYKIELVDIEYRLNDMLQYLPKE